MGVIKGDTRSLDNGSCVPRVDDGFQLCSRHGRAQARSTLDNVNHAYRLPQPCQA